MEGRDQNGRVGRGKAHLSLQTHQNYSCIYNESQWNWPVYQQDFFNQDDKDITTQSLVGREENQSGWLQPVS